MPCLGREGGADQRCGLQRDADGERGAGRVEPGDGCDERREEEGLRDGEPGDEGVGEGGGAREGGGREVVG